jgi:uncharacterized LabA/DUF88 family protein
MSLRFFRKKAGEKDAAQEDIDITKEEKKKPARRQTSRARASNAASKSESAPEKKTPSRSRAPRKTTAPKPPARSARPATPVASSAEPPNAASSTDDTASGTSATTKSSNGRRRGRRGGAGRNKAAAAKAAVTPTAVTPTKEAVPVAKPGTLEAVLQDLASQQVSTLKGLQGSLSSIENRLASGVGTRSSSLADRPRIGIFVDVPNIMYAAEREGVVLDYGKVLDYIIGNRELVRASAYSPISDDPDEELDTQRFVQPFMDLGYRIVTKPLKRYANGTIKANFDVELAIDVLLMSDRLDIVVLLSGDGDFRRLVEIVASKGVRVEVVAFGPSTAGELRTVADVYTDLNDHLPELRVKA